MITEISEIGYDDTRYKLKHPIELTLTPNELGGVIAVNKELWVSANGYPTFREDDAKKVAIENVKAILAHKYEENSQISDEHYTEHGLNAKYKLMEIVEDPVNPNTQFAKIGSEFNQRMCNIKNNS